MISYLAASVDLNYGDLAGRENVSRVAIHPQREHRMVLQQPDLIGRVLVAFSRVLLHRVPSRHVIDATEPPNL